MVDTQQISIWEQSFTLKNQNPKKRGKIIDQHTNIQC